MAIYGDGKHNQNMEYIDNGTDYYVDIPQLFGGEPSAEWRNIATFKTYTEALEYVQKHFGADENGKICLISY